MLHSVLRRTLQSSNLNLDKELNKKLDKKVLSREAKIRKTYFCAEWWRGYERRTEEKAKEDILNFKQAEQEISADLLNAGHAIQIFLLFSSKLFLFHLNNYLLQ